MGAEERHSTSDEAEESQSLSNREMMDLIFWLIDRYDTYRGSVANRAALLLSADTLLLAGVTFLLDKMISSGSHSLADEIAIISSIGITIALLASSILYATSGVVNVWKTSREMIGSDMPQRLFFHPTDTVKFFRTFKHFEADFRASDKDQLTTYALGELWTVAHLHYIRYQVLRRAIRLLLLSILPFSASVLIAIIIFR